MIIAYNLIGNNMRKLLLFFIALSFLANCSFIVINDECNKAITQTAAELPLFNVVSALSDASNQITGLVKTQMPLAPVFKQAQTNPVSDTKANDNSYIFNTFNSQSTLTAKLAGSSVSFYSLIFSEDSSLQFRQSCLTRCRDWTNFLCVFLLIYLVLLSKSNLPWEIFAKSTL
jgi:hypothetical protein